VSNVSAGTVLTLVVPLSLLVVVLVLWAVPARRRVRRRNAPRPDA
jgi:hypothetical protein